ncbi:MAG: MaoC family dehydratase [Ignavibacteriales bacterium]|nr:MaoC family dehydratase [Ignavibacteriales bacterium]
MEIKVNSCYEEEFFISDNLVQQFANLTGDINPLHSDNEFVKKTKFGQRIAHGGILFGLLSRILGTKFPGGGTVYIYQNLNFLLPVYPNTKVKVMIKVKEVLPKFGVVLHQQIWNSTGELVCEGEAKIKLPEWCMLKN